MVWLVLIYIQIGFKKDILINAFITGDAVGLATRDLCEGIGPAIRSGQRAANAITKDTTYNLEDIGTHSSNYALVRKLLDYMFIS